VSEIVRKKQYLMSFWWQNLTDRRVTFDYYYHSLTRLINVRFALRVEIGRGMCSTVQRCIGTMYVYGRECRHGTLIVRKYDQKKYFIRRETDCVTCSCTGGRPLTSGFELSFLTTFRQRYKNSGGFVPRESPSMAARLRRRKT